MTKIGKKQYIMLIAETLVTTYGDDLKEGGIDVKMAKSVVGKLKRFLYFHPQDVSNREFRKWKEDRDPLKKNP